MNSMVRKIVSSIVALLLFLCIAVSAHATDWYVSRDGSNANGNSWTTAWNELDKINWTQVQPGDTIWIDGGANEMTYRSTLQPKKSGTAGNPITIKRSEESGRNGTVRIFGGRLSPLPMCKQLLTTYQERYEDTVRSNGIVFDRDSQNNPIRWVVIDGGRWNGIEISGHTGPKNALQNTNSSDLKDKTGFAGHGIIFLHAGNE
jgi:hypothetical protein